MPRVTLSFNDPRARPEGDYFTMRVRLPFEKHGTPGRHTALFELCAGSDDAACSFLDDASAYHWLSKGMVIELWQLPRLVGHAKVK